jgi:predicted aspartyl protease
MGNKTLNWLFDTGAAIMCMNTNSFRESFGHLRPKLLKKSAVCITANGSKMSSLGFFEIEMTI